MVKQALPFSSSETQCSDDADGAVSKTQHALVVAVLILVPLIYSIGGLLAKATLSRDTTSPLIFASYRCLLGSMVMFCLHLALRKPGETIAHGLRALRADFPKLIALGTCMMLNIGANIMALEQASAITCSIFQPLLPIIAGAFASILGIEELSANKAFGTLAAAAGALLVIIFGGDGHTGGGSDVLSNAVPLHAVLLLMVNISGGALYAVLQKPLLKVHPPVLLTSSAFFIASCPLFAVAATSDAPPRAWVMQGDHLTLMTLLYAVVGTSACNYSLMAWANRETGPTTVASFQTLQPVFTALLAWLLWGETLNVGQAMGGALIICGLLFFPSTPAEDKEVVQPILAGKKLVIID
eukprot:CAMPEP_0178409642 /NCGR_PEP_ID=MMETSP0689_2-20121128/20567_1 /TAXON_ID=160604 /ORGANISM="Amphidinium massartii, Strain CS-259" /LENGTH=354 /DNA_ID=CAMNT_0020030789 /DNA_START=96 /DNA_END=1160 /DNA_ORIENTATION=+